jgi:hypothetical protein
MARNEEKPKDESQQVSQPAGEATGSDLPPEGQGGPHLPDISEPTSQSLSEQIESETPTVDLPTEQPPKELARTCTICNGPDHRGCGCEAKAKRELEQAGSRLETNARMVQELDREDAKADQVQGNLDDVEEKLIQMAGEMSGALMGGADKFEEFKSGVLDSLRDINSNLETLVKLEKDRADLLKDIKNVEANQN